MSKLSTQKVCKMARAFEGVTEKEHFGSDAFVANGRIFATVWHDKNQVNLMLNQEQQKSFLVRDGSEGFIPMENAWGKNAIGTDLATIDPAIFEEALHTAWVNSANKRTPLKRAASKAKMTTAAKKKAKRPGKKIR